VGVGDLVAVGEGVLVLVGSVDGRAARLCESAILPYLDEVSKAVPQTKHRS
jgi:hypothetical protein